MIATWQEDLFQDLVTRNPDMICAPEIWAYALDNYPYKKSWGCGWRGKARDAKVQVYEHAFFRTLRCPKCDCPVLDEFDKWKNEQDKDIKMSYYGPYGRGVPPPWEEERVRKKEQDRKVITLEKLVEDLHKRLDLLEDRLMNKDFPNE